jgi:acyl-CoA reductase-like NAD-dependent aldehyde dehydrogenase
VAGQGDARRLVALVDGRPPVGPGTVVVVDKFRGTPAWVLPAASRADVAAAVAAARLASRTPLPAHERYRILQRAADLLEQQQDEFVDALIIEAGKPAKASRVEVRRSIETLRWSAEEAKRLNGESIPLDAAENGVGRLGITFREPVGVVAAISPSNAPLNLVAHKVGPALAAGNAVVLKPPQVTPVSSVLLQWALLEAGLPAGLFHVVVGPDLGDALLENPGVDFFTFTGSVEVGEHLRRTIGLRDALLELGGNSPVIVHADADLARASAACARMGFGSAGQACTSVQRIYVHEDVVEDMLERLRADVDALVVGDPRDAATDIGPLIALREAERVVAWAEEAVASGATMVTGGRREGSLVWPIVLTGVPRSAKVYCEEVFGPVVVIESYTDIGTAIDAANDSPFGLNAAVFTASLDLAFDVVRRLEAGTVLVNEGTQWRTEYVPFGGIKNSGIGREGPRYAIERMTRLKLALLALEPAG